VRELARDLFHSIFEGQFPLFEGDFFEVIRVREVVVFGEPVEPVVQLVVLLCQLAVPIVGS
jgi:hypothetical protein